MSSMATTFNFTAVQRLLSGEQGGNTEHTRFLITNYLPVPSDGEVCVLQCPSCLEHTVKVGGTQKVPQDPL